MSVSIRVPALVAALLMTGLAHTPARAADAAPPLVLAADSPAQPLPTDTVLATDSGARFEVARGWFVSTAGGRVLLEDPDRELRLTLLEMRTGGPVTDGASAIAAAWAKAQPGFAREVRHATDPPARDGWDAIRQQVYESSTDEKRTVVGIARRKGEVWYVALLDGADAALDRRGAQINTVLLSFKAPGAERESFAGRPAHALDAERQARLAAFVDSARVATRVPGAAVAVVQGGRVVFQRGFGVRDLRDRQPVTPGTLFMIGSTTKSLTTLLMARLADSGRLAWGQRVVEMYPGFALGDSDVTRQVTLAHTVCACTGLPRQDLEMLFEFAGLGAEQTVARMRSMKPTTGFGETFQYSNTMVSTGGYVAAHVAHPALPLGEAYDRAMQSLVYEPLGMSSTTCDFGRVARANHARPHGEDLRGTMLALPMECEHALVPVRPAGGAWSSVEDLARYLSLELAGGLGPGGTRVVSEANLLRRREPQVKITDELSYGLGLFVETETGVRVVHHGGNTLGFTSDLFFLPEHGVGVVVLANAGGANTFRNVVHRRVLELLFDGREEATESLDYSLARQAHIREKELAEVQWAPERSWLRGLAGTYDNPALGRVRISVRGTEAVFDTGEWRSGLARKTGADGVAKVLLTSPPWAGLELVPTARDGRTSLRLVFGQQEYDFVPAAR